MKKKSWSCASIQAVKSSQAWRIEAVKLSKQLKIVRARLSYKPCIKVLEVKNQRTFVVKNIQRLNPHLWKKSKFCNLLYKSSVNYKDTKFVCTNISHTQWDHLYLSSPHFQSLLPIKLLKSQWLLRRMPPTTLLSTSLLSINLLSTNLLPCLHKQILRSI